MARPFHLLRIVQRRIRAFVPRLGERGAVAVEAGLTFPIFILVLYGIIELSLYAFTSMAVEDAARDGARYAIVRGGSSPQPATAQTITNYIKGRVSLIKSAQTTVAVTFTPDNNPGSVVQVQVSYPFTPYMPGFGYLVANNLSSTSKMTISQ